MLRRKIDAYLNNWKKFSKSALLVTGARQVGKTYSITNFINKEFESAININFSMRSDLVDLFVQLKNSNQLLILLQSICGDKLLPHKTVVFLDEIQIVYQRREELKQAGLLKDNSQDIITAMKEMVLEGDYRFILSGSLLGVVLKNVFLYPVGYIEQIQMFPLDFEEYLWAKGVGENAINHLRECFENKSEVFEGINNLFLDYFDEYVLIGGMPEAVNAFIEEKNVYKVQIVHEKIIGAYFVDITRYINSDEKKVAVRKIYQSIASELNNPNKRFISSHVLDMAYLRKNGFEDDYLWLSFASVAIPVYNVTEPVIPLMLASERRTLKLFFNDIGLLDYNLLSTGIREKLIKNEKEINYGAPYENVIAQELYAHGFYEKLFYYNSKKHGEVDFVIEYNDEVLPIEIKSGKPNQMNIYNHTALNNLVKMYNLKQAIIFGECNVLRLNDSTYQLPIYMIMFLNNNKKVIS